MISFVLAASDHGAMIVNRHDYNVGYGGTYGVSHQILENGCYDPRDVDSLQGLLRCRRSYHGDGVVALDGGANLGVHTLSWARLLRGWGTVLAVEAQERIFYALAGNIALQNAFNARAIWGALGDACGELQIPVPDYTRPGSFGSFELQARVGGEFIGQAIDYGRPSSTVRTFTIDSLKLERVDLIKLDLEGMEPEALDGAQATIERCKPILFVETVKSDRDVIKSALESSGYVGFNDGMNLLAIHESDQTLDHVTSHKELAT